MGCLSRLLVIGAILIQFLAAALGLLVLGSAGVLGEAALISSSDAILLFVLLALSLAATFVLRATGNRHHLRRLVVGRPGQR